VVFFRTKACKYGWKVIKYSEDKKILGSKHFEYLNDAEYYARVAGRKEHIQKYLKQK
jgi:hypothetical protein